MSQKYFHFTLGPVQSFVAQARRTRDFWAGSFLLSYLSGVAILATQVQGGIISFPLPDQKFLDDISGTGDGTSRQGNLPNRFKAEVGESFDPKKVIEAVQQAWYAIAQSVWNADLSNYAGTKTQEIWQRQVENFWEMNWALSTEEAASDLLDRRKNWRTHLPSAEAGQKCSIMAGFQELSGEDVAQSKAQGAFWEKLRNSKKNFELDLNVGEYLCALAFIKRRFIRIFKTFTCKTCGFSVKGWNLSAHQSDNTPSVPSVALLAAAPWLAGVAKHEKIQDFIDVCDALGTREMPVSEIKMLRDSDNRDLLRLDGMACFDVQLDNPRLYEDRKKARAVQKALKPLYADNTPSPFYAILMMDGDRLGTQMGDISKQKSISGALQNFTNKVGDIVDEHSGFLIYAGGDDVLAILPLESAMQCAADLRQSYMKAFAPHPDVETSISAAIIYAHIKNPLHAVLQRIHILLDDVAKEATGRDALAVQVLKPGGIQMTWAKKWDAALEADKVHLDELAAEYRNQTEQGQYSSGFFFRIREIMELIKGIGTLEQQEALLAVEYRAGTQLKQEEALKIIKPLLRQCTDDHSVITADAALIVRFLAQKGVEA